MRPKTRLPSCVLRPASSSHPKPSFSIFSTLTPPGAAVSSFSVAVPTWVRRAANSARSFMSAATRPSLRVVRAFTPRRIHASSCASFFDLRSQ